MGETLPAIIKQQYDVLDTAWHELSPATQKAYQPTINEFLKWCGKDLDNINPADVSGFIQYLKNANRTNKTINLKISALSKFFELNKIVGNIRYNPLTELKKITKNNKLTLSIVKCAEFSVEKKDVDKVCNAVPRADWERRIIVIIDFIKSQGIRVSECINIRHDDIKLGKKGFYRIHVMGKGSKPRYLNMGKTMYKKVYNCFPVHNDYLFYTIRGNKFNRSVIWRLVKKIFYEKCKKNIHPHELRHYWATEKIKAGFPLSAVSKYLGHSGVGITGDTYDHNKLSEEDCGL